MKQIKEEQNKTNHKHATENKHKYESNPSTTTKQIAFFKLKKIHIHKPKNAKISFLGCFTS